MKIILFIAISLLTFSRVSVSTLRADKLVLVGNQTISGTVLQTNDGHILLLTDYGTQSILQSIVKEVNIERPSASKNSKTDRLPDSKTLIFLLSKQIWATQLKQIPATVIDKGILKNVPYISFRCGGDYEVNIYGDLDHPAGIEAGVFRTLLNDAAAKSNCIAFAGAFLGRATDKAIVQELDLNKDIKSFDGYTFEITPPSAEDSYGGWWISIYSEKALSAARATPEEMGQITTKKGDADPSAWSPDELKLARSASKYPSTITFTDSSGQVITNAEVVKVNDGYSLIWRKGLSGGTLKLADLPEDQRAQFGYDPTKASAGEAADKERALKLSQAVAAQNAQAPLAQKISDPAPSPSSGTGTVYVRGYTKSNGTYVQPYTRRK